MSSSRRGCSRTGGQSDAAAASVVGGMIVLAVCAAIVPAALSYHSTLRAEMDAHIKEVRHEVDLARALAAEAQAAASAAKAEAQNAKNQTMVATATLNLIAAISEAAEANADLARVQAEVAKKGAFCAKNPNHPDCPLLDNEWIQGYTCVRQSDTRVFCKKN